MKKISNEIKVGFTALITILVFVWLFNFLKGKDFLSSTNHYYSIYEQVGGLAVSSPVEVNGYQVGVVQSIDFIDPVSGRLLVVISVDKGFKLPKNTVAEITTATLVAGMKIQFVYGDGPGFYSNGDTIPGRLAESLITKLENELVPMKERIMDLVTDLDSVVSSVNEIMDPRFKENLSSGITSLSKTAKSIEEADLGASLENINKFTKMLADNSDSMTNTFSNLESVSDTLAAADIYNSIARLKSTLENTTLLLENLNKGKGTAGQLITNDSLYYNLSNSVGSLNLLLMDIKSNPKKYVHFSLFGK